MLELLLVPFRIVGGILSGVFGIVFGVIGAVFGIIGGVIGLTAHLLAIALIVGLIAVVFRRRSKKAAHDDFVSFYDQHH